MGSLGFGTGDGHGTSIGLNREDEEGEEGQGEPAYFVIVNTRGHELTRVERLFHFSLIAIGPYAWLEFDLLCRSRHVKSSNRCVVFSMNLPR